MQWFLAAPYEGAAGGEDSLGTTRSRANVGAVHGIVASSLWPTIVLVPALGIGFGVICLIWWAYLRQADSAMWTVKTASATFTIRCDPTKSYEPFKSYPPIDAGPWIVTVQGPHAIDLGYNKPERFALYDDAMARVKTIQRNLGARSAEPA